MPNKNLPASRKNRYKSGKMRRQEIRQARIKNAQQNAPPTQGWPQYQIAHHHKGDPPKGAIKSNPDRLFSRSVYLIYPLYYADKAFICARCGREQLWTAKQQKWWYEIQKGEIESTAKHCRPCRQALRSEKQAAKKAHYLGLIQKYGLEKAAHRLRVPVAKLEAWRDNNIV